MIKEQKLEKIIEKAMENGWEQNDPIHDYHVRKTKHKPNELTYYVGDLEIVATHHSAFIYKLEQVIFSHDFLKAYFGEEDVCRDCGTTLDEEDEFCKECVEKAGHDETVGDVWDVPRWQYHAQMLVLEKDRIEYLYKHL